MPQQRSEAAREASRRNGAHSKGPRTVMGRTRVAYNALRHGLRGRQTIEPAYLPEWLKAFERGVTACYPDITQRRRECLDRILGCMLLINQADELIVLELERLHATVTGGLPPASEPFDAKRFKRLLQYRRRFRATRDRALSRLIVSAEPKQKHKPLFRFRKPRKKKAPAMPISAAQFVELIQDGWAESA